MQFLLQAYIPSIGTDTSHVSIVLDW